MAVDIRPLASSSAGNAYAVSDGVTTLLLECGINIKQIREALDFRLSEVAGCILTHSHSDHGKAAADIMRAGIDVYASEGTLRELGLTGHRAIPIRAMVPFTIGTWTVMPFDVQHDTAQPVGYLLANKDGQKVMMATDTYYLRFRYSGLTHIMVEANYSLAILDKNVAEGRVPAGLRRRLLHSHFSLENVIEFLKANDLRRVQEIHLLHLSDTNADEALFKRKIQEITGCPVYIAGK